MGATLVAKRLKRLDKCVGATLRCVQLEPGDAECIAGAYRICAAQLAKVATETATIAARISKTCSAAPLAFADVLSADGLGFASRDAACTADFDAPLTDLGAIASCIVRQHACEAERILGLQSPRAHELLRALHPGLSGLEGLSCLADQGGTGETQNDPDGTGGAAVRCARAIAKAGARVVATKLKGLAQCADAVFTCVQTKPEHPTCQSKAARKCDKQLAKVAVAAAGIGSALTNDCGDAAVSFGVIRSEAALNLETLHAECGSYGVPMVASIADYAECLARQHACRAEALFSLEMPRAETMLGVAGHPLHSPFCP